MFRLSENQRFYFTIGLLSAVAVVLVGRLVLIHCDLVSKKPDQPNYSFTRDTQGLRGAGIAVRTPRFFKLHRNRSRFLLCNFVLSCLC